MKAEVRHDVCRLRHRRSAPRPNFCLVVFHGQGFFNHLDDFAIIRLGRAGEAGDHITVAVDDELGEVPADVALEAAGGGFLGQKLVQRGLVVS